MNAGGVIGLVLEAYPKIQVHAMAACNTISMHPITNVPVNTSCVYMIYTLPDNAIIEESKLNLPKEAVKKAGNFVIPGSVKGEA